MQLPSIADSGSESDDGELQLFLPSQAKPYVTGSDLDQLLASETSIDEHCTVSFGGKLLCSIYCITFSLVQLQTLEQTDIALFPGCRFQTAIPKLTLSGGPENVRLRYPVHGSAAHPTWHISSHSSRSCSASTAVSSYQLKHSKPSASWSCR